MSSTEEFIKNYSKTKVGKIYDLKYEIEHAKSNYIGYDKLTYLSAVISILTKNTRYEYDATEIIKMVCPEFYKDF